MSEFVRRIYVDSRWRMPGSQGPSNFSVDLGESLQCQSDTCVHVRAVSFPNSWWTVDAGRERLALRLTLGDNPPICLFVYPQRGFHDGFSFATELVRALNETTPAFFSAPLPLWDASYIASENRIVVQWGESALPERTWQILSEPELLSLGSDWTGPGFDRGAPGLLDDVLRMGASSGGVNVNENTWVSGGYDSRAGIHELYIHSDLGRPLTMGPRLLADRNVICRVPVHTQYGDVEHYEAYAHTYDFTPCYWASNKQLTFTITDYRGRVVEFAGSGDVSIELLFYRQPD